MKLHVLYNGLLIILHQKHLEYLAKNIGFGDQLPGMTDLIVLQQALYSEQLENRNKM